LAHTGKGQGAAGWLVMNLSFLKTKESLYLYLFIFIELGLDNSTHKLSCPQENPFWDNSNSPLVLGIFLFVCQISKLFKMPRIPKLCDNCLKKQCSVLLII
jgi:hypothetical protein